jgi:hypothetical protein
MKYRHGTQGEVEMVERLSSQSGVTVKKVAKMIYVGARPIPDVAYPVGLTNGEFDGAAIAEKATKYDEDEGQQRRRS